MQQSVLDRAMFVGLVLLVLANIILKQHELHERAKSMQLAQSIRISKQILVG